MGKLRIDLIGMYKVCKCVENLPIHVAVHVPIPWYAQLNAKRVLNMAKWQIFNRPSAPTWTTLLHH